MAVDPAHTTWVLISTALVLIMIPGIGLFYSGMTKRKSALSLLWLSLMAISIASIQWFLFGYSLTYSMSGSFMIGNFAHVFSINVFHSIKEEMGVIPETAFYIFQLMFAATASTIVIGAGAERGRIWPTILFVFLWLSFVYNFLAYWIWSSRGWAVKLGVLDFAGGGPVHIAAGTSALVYSYMLGPRLPVTRAEQNRPHNLNNIFVGATLSWFGWLGFNAGSGLRMSSRTALACIVTNLAASTGGFTWCMLDYFLAKPKYKFSLFGFCMGAMAGLVCITPASGFVNIQSSFVFGIGGSVCVYFGRQIKILLKIDDAFDIFAQHGVGGLVGTILTGVFAQKYIAEIDEVIINGGWLDRNWIQVLYQLAYAASSFFWSAIVTGLILVLMNYMPGLRLRISSDREERGLDFDQFNEHTHDYIEVQRDLYSDLNSRVPAVNNFVTVTTVDEQNVVHRQTDIKMVKIKPVSVSNNAW